MNTRCFLTYPDRVAQIRRPGDEQAQLRRAKDRMMDIRRALRKAATWEEKQVLSQRLAQAEAVLRQLRLNIFILEDLAEARKESDAERIAELEAQAGL